MLQFFSSFLFSSNHCIRHCSCRPSCRAKYLIARSTWLLLKHHPSFPFVVSGRTILQKINCGFWHAAFIHPGSPNQNVWLWEPTTTTIGCDNEPRGTYNTHRDLNGMHHRFRTHLMYPIRRFSVLWLAGQKHLHRHPKTWTPSYAAADWGNAVQ